MVRRIAVAATTVALAAGFGGLGTGLASAAGPAASCSTTGSVVFSPGMSSVPTDETATLAGSFTGCTGTAKVGTGTFKGTTTAKQLRCLSAITPGTVLGTGTETITWKNGTTSTVAVTIKVGNSVFGFSGTVTKGRLKGHKLSSTYKPTSTGPANANCSTVPVTTINFSGKSTVS